mmetsp:Transcript_5043/g.7351  ORF Transcript_5043/g.7351 Transcript_5043/m.7351 type:complete len:685 (+) Transcript_5043:768-2822(+)
MLVPMCIPPIHRRHHHHHHHQYNPYNNSKNLELNEEGEFFVEEDKSISIEHMWHGRYILKKDRIPHSIMDEKLARNILVLGKGINFVRKCLGYVDWAPDLNNVAFEEDEMNRSSGDGRSNTTGFFSVGNNSNDRFGGGSYYHNRDNDDHYKDDETRRNDKKVALGYHYDPPSLASIRGGAGGFLDGGSILHQTISRASRLVHSHILSSLLGDDHQLFQHLWALKQFLFLGQGDFVTALMGLLHREFDGRLGSKTDGLYFHTMMSILEHAIRTTNARFLPQNVLDRLKVELNYGDDGGGQYAMGPPLSVVGGEGNERKRGAKKGNGFSDDEDGDSLSEEEDDEVGQNKKKRDSWDIFSLVYDVDAPLTAVVHPSAMKQYKRIFDLLFRLKRIEWMLNRTWRNSTALNHAMGSSARRGDFGGFGDSGNDEWAAATALLRRVSMTTQSMLHFTSNLQSYFMFEVLEVGWKGLVRKIKSARTLDELIEAHDAYLEEIVEKSLLENEDDTTQSEEGRSAYTNVPSLAKQLKNVLDITLRFCKLQDRIFCDALDSIDTAARRRRRAERRSKAGRWGYVEKDIAASDLYTATFRRLANAKRKQEMEKISGSFDVALKNLLATLNREINEPSSHQNSYAILGNMSSPQPLHRDDGNIIRGEHQQQQLHLENHDSLRFLTFRLDFSEYYTKQS